MCLCVILISAGPDEFDVAKTVDWFWSEGIFHVSRSDTSTELSETVVSDGEDFALCCEHDDVVESSSDIDKGRFWINVDQDWLNVLFARMEADWAFWLVESAACVDFSVLSESSRDVVASDDLDKGEILSRTFDDGWS